MDPMLSKALREFNSGPLNQLLVNLGGTEAELWDTQLKHFLRKEQCWASPLPAVSQREAQTINFTRCYHELGMDQEYADFLTAHPPQFVDGCWGIPVLKGVTPNKVVKVLRRLNVAMSLYFEDLDKSVTINDRDPKDGSYWIQCTATIEADEENKNLSANMLAERGTKGLTLLERLLLELAYWLTTTKHLDIKNITLCSGSRYSDGSVPSVGWGSDYREVCVDWYSPDSRGGRIRARTVRQ